KKNYLWYRHIPENLNIYDESESLYDFLNAMRYRDDGKLVDRWSYIAEKQAHSDYYAGKYYGFGFGRRKVEDRYFITIVYPGSPAWDAEMRRGMEILEVDGYSIEEIENNQAYNNEHSSDPDYEAKPDWNSLLKKEEQGVPVEFKLRKTDGTVFKTTAATGEVTVKSVLNHAVVEHGGEHIAYLALKSYINSTYEELDEVFEYFSTRQEQEDLKISKMVLDLRYNGGGWLGASEHLASLIGGKNISESDIYAELTYNDKRQDYNKQYYFSSLGHALNIEDLAVITTGGTASASEATINGLEPFINVALVGKTTSGKPVGMNSWDICNYTFVPITFKVANAEGYGDYFFGIETDCPAEDDVTQDFGSPEEKSMSEALHFLNEKECSPKSQEIETRTFIEDRVAPLRGIYGIIGTM
ncbi:MAG: S41 family peptidase, partial [bacterium]